MRRRLPIALAVAAGTLGWPLAVPALAGTYTWQLPTSSAPGSANPDHDVYGATPWAYVEAATPSMAGPPSLVPGSFQPLATFSTAIDGALTGWLDTVDPDQPFVAVNRTGAAVTGQQGLQIPAGQLALQPAGDRVVAIGWTSPLSASETVSVSGTFLADAQTSMCPGSQPTWALEQDGLVIASQPPPAGPGQPSPQPFTASTTIAPGDTLYLVVGWYGVSAGFSQPCTTAGVTLSIQAPSSVPSVSLATPSSGQTIAGGQPGFSGSSSRSFGDSGSVAVRIWRGRAATGTPLEVLSADGSTGRYSVSPSPPLPNGTYTAQAEQDDLAGDSGFSTAVTFKVHNIAPKVAINGLPRHPLTGSQPWLSGRAGSAVGDSRSVQIGIWAGSNVTGRPVRRLTATRGRDGRWSVRVSPALPNGRFTAIAVQDGPGGVYGVSRPVRFTIKLPVIAGPPTLTHTDQAEVPITCTAASGSCTGDVSVVTQQGLRPRPDGPSGHVRVLFAYVSVPAGRTVTVRRSVPSYVAATLRRERSVRVAVTVRLRDSAGHPVTASAVLALRLTR